MKFGICSAPHALGEPSRLMEVMTSAGADYLEWAVGAVMSSEAEWEKLRALTADAPLKPEAFNSFLPPTQRITGPDVKLQQTLDYASEAMRRCRALGAEIVVLGSSGARRVPEGWAPMRALDQFETFCRELGPRAAQHGITIAIEPLNHTEDNLVNSVAAGAAIVDAVSHPNIRLLADFYHIFHDDEAVDDVAKVGARLKHAHLADLGRVAPGFAAEGEADFVGFFRALNAAGYDARCSFEGKTHDLAAQAKTIIAHMKERQAQALESSELKTSV